MRVSGFNKKADTSIHGNYPSKTKLKNRKAFIPDSEYLISSDDIELSDEIISQRERKQILEELCNKRHSKK